MAEVEIYTTMFCPFCVRAKKLLESKGVPFTEIDVSTSSSKRAEMTEKANGRYTVPQIFIDGAGIGGSDELAALEASGKLDEMLQAKAS
ncbi:glutaredoxin 3 [Nisaea sp.]|uniref:glutaredoxin 3 n=1 Tax=Nisaea sp. TaxID=2024842 RepID=UPI002B26B3A2|nr:glutaredoxin 3 [Nisaea sp.]